MKFTKMQGCGNDYIFFDNRDKRITSPESLCVSICDRHYGVGAYGIVLIENSSHADAKMRIFNRDGSEGRMAGNSIRCGGKRKPSSSSAAKKTAQPCWSVRC